MLSPLDNPRIFLRHELCMRRLHPIHSLLWLAGLPRPCRALHRQRLIGRTIYITERPEEHLIWRESRIFIKPLPAFLLDAECWAKELCADEELHRAACGMLLSYSWLVRHKSDFDLAQMEGLVPRDIDWEVWRDLMGSVLQHINVQTLHQVDKRYQYGELRLSRLSSLYRVCPSVCSMRNLVLGYTTHSTWYKAFFRQHFAWLLAIFAYFTVVLSALQVGLATELLYSHASFQKVAHGVVIASLVVFFAIGISIFGIWFVLLLYHFFSTFRYTRRVEAVRRKHMRNLSWHGKVGTA